MFLLAEVGSPDLSTAHGIVTFGLLIALAIVAWLGKDKVSKQEKESATLAVKQEKDHETIGKLETSVAVLQASKTEDRLDRLETSHEGLSARVSEIASDVKVIRSIVEDEGGRRP